MRKLSYEESRKRVSELVWKDKLSKYLERTEDGNPPTYGVVVDEFRYKYNIYISVYPVKDIEIDSNKRLIIRYSGEVMKANGNEVLKESIVADHTYEDAMRKCIDIAISYIE